jgi:hypothetical protein
MRSLNRSILGADAFSRFVTKAIDPGTHSVQ